VQAAQLLDDQVKPLAVDELHDVVVQAVGLADAVDGDDIRVVKPSCCFSLTLEAHQVARIQQRVPRQYLEGHVAAERFLFGLVDDAHAAAADLAQDAVVAQSLQAATLGQRRVRAGEVVARRLELLDLEEGGEQVADGVGQFGMALGVLGQRGPFATAVALDEFLGQLLQQVAARSGVGHGGTPARRSASGR
jgi:hypothetical protein